MPGQSLDAEQLLANAGEAMEQFFVVPKVGYEKEKRTSCPYPPCFLLLFLRRPIQPYLQESYFGDAEPAAQDGRNDACAAPSVGQTKI